MVVSLNFKDIIFYVDQRPETGDIVFLLVTNNAILRKYLQIFNSMNLLGIARNLVICDWLNFRPHFWRSFIVCLFVCLFLFNFLKHILYVFFQFLSILRAFSFIWSLSSQEKVLGNIHATRNSCRDTYPCATGHERYPGIFTCWRRRVLVATSNFGLLTIKRHSAIRKYSVSSRWQVRSEKAKKG